MLRQLVRRPRSRDPNRFVAPPPGFGSGRPDPSGSNRALPTLPVVTIGAPPPGRPPGVMRATPRLGGMRGVALPPEILRRIPDTVKAMTGAAQAADRDRVALAKAKQKLLDSQQRLEATVAALRAQLAAPTGRP